MTYEEFAQHILKHFNQEQKDSDVTIADGKYDPEFFLATLAFIDPTSDEADVLGPGHPFLLPKLVSKDVEAVCKKCGVSCKYNSEICLCPKCEEMALGG